MSEENNTAPDNGAIEIISAQCDNLMGRLVGSMDGDQMSANALLAGCDTMALAELLVSKGLIKSIEVLTVIRDRRQQLVDHVELSAAPTSTEPS